MIKKFAILIAVVALTGCATSYTYNEKKYDSKEKFQQAVDSTLADVISSVIPLQTPLSRKKIIIAIQSEKTTYKINFDYFVKINGNEPNSVQSEVIENLSKSIFKNLKVFADAVQKKNIYATTQFIETQGTTESFVPSADTDVLYLVIPSASSGQWYFASAKNDKQIFSFDRSSTTPEGKVQAFVDAVQAQAVRD